MNKDFTESPSPEDLPCQFAGALEQLGVGSVSPPRWMQAHLTECLSCLNDFARLQSLNFHPDVCRLGLGGGRPTPTEEGMLDFVQELGAFMLERKKFWLLPIVGIVVLFVGLLVVTQGSAVAPFIFTAW